MTKYLAVLLTLAMFICVSASLSENAFSQDLVQKIGNRCPGHYAPDGAYCKPLPGAKEIITKIVNRCPSGFASDGDYCYRIQNRPAKVIPKVGSRCPNGYRSDGAYCVTLN